VIKKTWSPSPVELEYLQKHQHDPINQLCIALAKTRYAIKKQLVEMDSKPGKKKRTGSPVPKTKIGKRKDLDNIFLRSGWEANCLRLFKADPRITLIEYEPYTFTFTAFGIVKGTVSYTPDFKLTYMDGSTEWVEIKGGFLKNTDKTKLRRFRKYFPDEFKKLSAITPGPSSKTYKFFTELGIPVKHCYPDLNKKYREVIPHWE